MDDALYDCFKDDMGTVNESQLHEDSYVKKKLKDFLGPKEFKKMDALSEKVWYEAWREFDVRVWHDRARKEVE
ncbi:hypothetical protein [Paenibacillus tianjinensis]|uniref:Uncharacterized protein n=1 Tax=Paenibacillus tianjinensis TaxID=2810347 RepID=A0ABX7L5K2_9BACL|nr:hypothetical protein [Paenibacillus tianjinensis]QSF43380.1 hypothetical protein JRJ22_19125 [Paenibacillus tianjinensis]